MIPLTMEYLENCFNRAMELGVNYVGVKIALPDAEGFEVIINGYENFEYKKEYYKKTYGEDLEHKFVGGLKIVGFTFGNSFKEIEEDLLGIYNDEYWDLDDEMDIDCGCCECYGCDCDLDE